jgi:hypothetical protein
MTYENDQFDVLEFLHGAPRIIEDFHQSRQFWVEELGRGVYPRSLLDMLIDMDLVVKFRPYKSTKEETDSFIKELDLDGVSDERKALLAKYTSFRLTEFGKESYTTSRTRELKTIDAESDVIEHVETVDTEEVSEPEPLDLEEDTEDRDIELEHVPMETDPRIEEEIESPIDDKKEVLDEIGMIEGNEDEEEPIAQENVRLIQINEEIDQLKKELDDAGFLSKRKIQKQIDDLEEERAQVEQST